MKKYMIKQENKPDLFVNLTELKMIIKHMEQYEDLSVRCVG